MPAIEDMIKAAMLRRDAVRAERDAEVESDMTRQANLRNRALRLRQMADNLDGPHV